MRMDNPGLATTCIVALIVVRGIEQSTILPVGRDQLDSCGNQRILDSNLRSCSTLTSLQMAGSTSRLKGAEDRAAHVAYYYGLTGSMQESADTRTEIEELLILTDSQKDGERSRSKFVVSFFFVTSK